MFTHSPRIVTDGLVLYLDAGNTKSYPGSGTVWKDLSGNGNNGTLINSPGYTSTNGGSLTFDGVDDYINCGNNASLKPSFIAIDTLVKPTVSKGLSFICGGGNTGNRGYWVGFSNTNRLGFSCRPSGGSSTGAQYFFYLPQSVIGSVFHFVSTYDGTQVKMFFNGVEVFSENLTGNLNYTGILNDNIHIGDIGSSGSKSDRFFLGDIYSVKIYNRALTSQEILQNYNATKGRYGL